MLHAAMFYLCRTEIDGEIPEGAAGEERRSRSPPKMRRLLASCMRSAALQNVHSLQERSMPEEEGLQESHSGTESETDAAGTG